MSGSVDRGDHFLLVIQVPVTCFQPHEQMFICRHNFSLRVRIGINGSFGRLKIFDPLAGHWFQRCRANRVAAESTGVSWPRDRLVRNTIRQAVFWEDNSVHSTSEQTVRPVGEQVSNVDQDRRTRVILRPRRADRDGCICSVCLEHLQTSLAFDPEKQSDGSVVGMGTSSDFIPLLRCCFVRGWVSQEA